MKHCIILIIGAGAVTHTAFGQGTINFANRVGSGATPSLHAPVYGPSHARLFAVQGNATTNINPGTIDYTGHPLLVGTGFTAALFGGPLGTAPEQLSFVASVPFRSGTVLGGIWSALPAASGVPGVPPGANATLQVRAWDNVGGTINSWAAVLAGAPQAARGTSLPFTAGPLGDPNDMAKAPANLNGMTSFSIGLAVVPEPAVFALGILGWGAALLFRRK